MNDKKMTMKEVRALEGLLKTFDRFGLMPQYLIMIERWSKHVGHWSYVEGVKRSFGVTISVLGHVHHRVEIVEDEDGD